MTTSRHAPRSAARRSALAFFAFLLGFGASVAAVQLSQADEGPDRPGTALGTIDVNVYCRDVHGPNAIPLLIRRNVNGWQCAIRDNGIFGTVAIDQDRACATQFGQVAHSDPTDVAWPYLWQCIAGERRSG